MIFLRHSAFSKRAMMLAELMVVMAIILVLFVMYWGGGFGGKTSKQRNFAACAKNLQTIHTALLTYATDNNEKFPAVPLAKTSEEALGILAPKYISQAEPFICPSSSDRSLTEGESFAKKKISYGYVMGFTRTSEPSQWIMSDEQVNVNPKSQGDPVFASTNQPPGANHGGFGGNLLMIDGSVKDISRKAPYSLVFTNAGARYLNPQPSKQ